MNPPTVWDAWERPWTRGSGIAPGYQPVTSPLAVGDVVALRQNSRPYLPTFAPWWLGLTVDAVDTKQATLTGDGRTNTFTFADFPLNTHWARLGVPPQ